MSETNPEQEMKKTILRQNLMIKDQGAQTVALVDIIDVYGKERKEFQDKINQLQCAYDNNGKKNIAYTNMYVLVIILLVLVTILYCSITNTNAQK